MTVPPLLGELYPNERRCLRAIGGRDGGLCMKPGAWHIIWSGSSASPACDECAEYARTTKKIESMHPIGPVCGMVGSMFFEEELACRMPESEDDIRSGRVVF